MDRNEGHSPALRRRWQRPLPPAAPAPAGSPTRQLGCCALPRWHRPHGPLTDKKQGWGLWGGLEAADVSGRGGDQYAISAVRLLVNRKLYFIYETC